MSLKHCERRYHSVLDNARFPVLNEVGQKFLVLFGSMRSYESGLSAMNHIKNKLRCRLTDTRFRHLLRLSVSPLCPQFSQLSRNMQNHPSSVCLLLHRVDVSFRAPVRLSLSHKINSKQDNLSSLNTTRQLVDVVLM